MTWCLFKTPFFLSSDNKRVKEEKITELLMVIATLACEF